MENLFGKITASLIDNDLSFPPELVDIINHNISPPEKVTADNIYIRAMYIVSDEVNSYGGRFPDDEFEKLMSLIIDSPVLIGHRKDSLPIARNFHAEQVQKGETNWIKVYFYRLKNAKGSETLKNNIDGGIYKECSISFVFSLPECSICGDDIRRCGHRPFKEYQTTDGEKSAAFFNYREIAKVLETSIVYRGSVHDTSITNELFFPANEQIETKNESTKITFQAINRIWNREQLDKTHQYQVRPAYESLRIILDSSDESKTACYCNGTQITSKNLDSYLSKLLLPAGKYSLDCRLIGYRGKERQKLSELSKYLENRKSKVTRLELKIFDIIGKDQSSELSEITTKLLIPSEIVTGDNLSEVINRLSTRCGVEITDCQTENIFLLTNKKRAFFEIACKEQVSNGYKYRLSGKIGESNVDSTTYVISKVNLSVGQMVEIEVSDLKLINNNIELTFPKIIDSTEHGTTNENLEFLIRHSGKVKLNSLYTVSRYRASDALLTIETNEKNKHYIIGNFSLERLSDKRRFLTEEVDTIKQNPGNQLGQGQVVQSDYAEASARLQFNGYLNGLYVIKPIVLNRKRRFLFSQIINKNSHGADDV